MSDDNNVSPSSLDQGVDQAIKPSTIVAEKYEKNDGKLVAKDRAPVSDTLSEPNKSWTMAEIERVVSSEIIPTSRQRLGQFGIGLARRSDFRLKDLAYRLERQTRQEFSSDISKGPIAPRLRNIDVRSHTLRMVTANASLGMYQFQKTQQLPFMRKSLALDYERTNLLKKVVSGISSLERAVVSKLEAIKLNAAAVVPGKQSQFAKIRGAIKDKINDRIATNFANVTLAGYDEKYKKYVSPTLERIHAKMALKGSGGGVNGSVGLLTKKLNALRHSVARVGTEDGKNPSAFNKLASNLLSGAVKVSQKARLPQQLSAFAAKPLTSLTSFASKVQPFEAPNPLKIVAPAAEKAIEQLSSEGSHQSSLLHFLKRGKKADDLYRKTLLGHVQAIRYQLAPDKHTLARKARVVKRTKRLPLAGGHQDLLPPANHHEDIRHPKPSVLTNLFGKLSDRIGKIDKSLITDRKTKALFDKAQAKQKALMDRLAQRAKARKGSYEDLEDQRRKGGGFIPWGKMGKLGMFGGAAAAERGAGPDPDNHPVDRTGIPSIGELGLMGLGAAGKNLLKYGWKGTKLLGKTGLKLGSKILPAAARGGVAGAGILGRFGLREVKGIGRVGLRGAGAVGAGSATGIARILGKSIKGVPLLSLGAEGIDYLDGEKTVNWRNLAKSGIALGGGALGGLVGGVATAGFGGQLVGGIGGYAAGKAVGNRIFGDDSVTNKPVPKSPTNTPSVTDRFNHLLATPDSLRKKPLVNRIRQALSTGSTDPNQPSLALRVGQGLRYGLTKDGMKYGWQKTFTGDRYSNGDLKQNTSLLGHLGNAINYTFHTNFSIGGSDAINGWSSSTGSANDTSKPFYAYVSLCLDAYGIKNRSLYSYLHSVETTQDKINNGQAKAFNDSDMSYIAGRCGFDPKNAQAVNYFKLWYKRRFLAALSLITRVLKSHRLTVNSVMGADDKIMGQVNIALKKEIDGADFKTLGLELSPQVYNKYAKMGSKPALTTVTAGLAATKGYDPRDPKNVNGGQESSGSIFGKFGSAIGSLFGGNQPQPASRNQAQIVKGGVKDQPQFKAAYAKLPTSIKKIVDHSKSLQFVLWSTSIQHGADAAALIFQRDYSDKLDEKGYIRSIYQDRSTKFSNLGSMDRTEAVQHLGEEQRFVEGMRTGSNNPDMATMGKEVSNVINPSGNSSLGYDPSSVKAAPITGNTASRAKDAMQYLMSKKYSKNAAAGIIGNLIEESALMTNRPGDGGRAYGLAQWHPDRRNPIAKQFGKPVEAMNFHEQLDAVDWEIRGGHGITGGKNLFNDLNNAKDAGEAARMVMNRYERPAERQQNGMKRANNAMGVLKTMGDASTPTAKTPSPTGSTAPAKSSSRPASSAATPQAKQKASPTDASHPLTQPLAAHSKSLDAHSAALQRHTDALGKSPSTPTSTKPPANNNTSIFSPIIQAASSAENFLSMSMKKASGATGEM